MKAFGIFLSLLGAVSSGVGVYFMNLMNQASSMTMGLSPSMMLSLGRELGMMQGMSFTDKLKMWCAENYSMCLVAGIAMLIIGIIMAVKGGNASAE